ncbi:hypothetical protein [Aureivirga sp. CE67]|uniref:hypothetical protein n=1 Tax=Aureivirga sp. CE67 TaxID=1788983 RepID=UPI0018CA86D1|nr:hypothetical protein [Aureivirga sp. CE67]
MRLIVFSVDFFFLKAGKEKEKQAFWINEYEGRENVGLSTVAFWFLENEKGNLIEKYIFEIENNREVVIKSFANFYYNEMLVEFSYRNNYEKAIEIGNHLLKPIFKDFIYRAEVLKLKNQLEQRKDIDFKTLKLPRIQEWEEIKKNLNRKEQIAFLFERLKLLNIVQQGQPMDLILEDKQYDFDSFHNKYELIHPYVLLKEMKLTKKEVLLYLDLFLSEEYFLAFSYWRDFSEQRQIHKIRELVNEIFKEIIHVDILTLEGFYELNKSQQKKVVEKWRKILEKDDEQSEKDFYKSILLDIKHWDSYRSILNKLIELGENKYVLQNVRNIISEGKYDFKHRRYGVLEPKEELFEIMYKIGEKEDIDFLKKYISDESKFVKIWVALFLLENDKDSYDISMKTISEIYENGDGTYYEPKTFDALVLIDDHKSKEILNKLFEKKHFMDYFLYGSYSKLLKYFLESGNEKLYALFFEELDLKKEDFIEEPYTKSYYSPLAIKENVLRLVGSIQSYEDLKYDWEWTEDQKIEAGKKLKKWLEGQYEIFKKGGKLDFDFSQINN